MNRTLQRVVGIAGALFVIFSVVGNEVVGKAGEAPVWADGAAAAGSFAQAQLAGGLFPVAVLLEVLALIALMIFTVGIAVRIHQAPAGGIVPAGIVVAASAVVAAVKGGSAALVLVAVLRAGDLPAELTWLLYDLNGAAFLLMAPFLATVLATAAIAGRRGGVLPRPLTFAAGPLALAGVAVPLLASTDAAVVPVLLMLVWILVSGISLAVQGDGARVAHPALT